MRSGAAEMSTPFRHTHDAHRLGDFIEEHGGRFVAAVAIAIFEDAHAAGGRARFAIFAAVVAHFGDPDFAVGSEIDCYRALDHRLGGDKLDPQTVGEL